MDMNLYTRAVEEFAKLDAEMQLPAMQTFLYVALEGPCSQKDIENKLGMSNATASRNVSYWCDHKKWGVEGMGFLERHEDPKDRRYKVVRLSPTGKHFLEKLRRK